MFNNKLYFKIYKLREGSEKYCFPLRIFLGENGLIENHELKGKIFIKTEDNEEFSVDNVYVHYWDGGYYYMALARNNNNSHAQITWNINCPMEDIENINNYKLVK